MMATLRKASGPAPAIRVPQATHAKLQELAKAEDRPMGDIVMELVDDYDKRKFWDEVNASLDRLHEDPVAWRDYLDEIVHLEGGATSAFKDEDPYFTPEEEAQIRAEARLARQQ